MICFGLLNWYPLFDLRIYIIYFVIRYVSGANGYQKARNDTNTAKYISGTSQRNHPWLQINYSNRVQIYRLVSSDIGIQEKNVCESKLGLMGPQILSVY